VGLLGLLGLLEGGWNNEPLLVAWLVSWLAAGQVNRF